MTADSGEVFEAHFLQAATSPAGDNFNLLSTGMDNRCRSSVFTYNDNLLDRGVHVDDSFLFFCLFPSFFSPKRLELIISQKRGLILDCWVCPPAGGLVNQSRRDFYSIIWHTSYVLVETESRSSNKLRAKEGERWIFYVG